MKGALNLHTTEFFKTVKAKKQGLYLQIGKTMGTNLYGELIEMPLCIEAELDRDGNWTGIIKNVPVSMQEVEVSASLLRRAIISDLEEIQDTERLEHLAYIIHLAKIDDDRPEEASE